MLAVAAAALAIGLPAVAGGSALVAAAEARGVADAAALAAADAASGLIEAEPCELAARLVGETSAQLANCEVNLNSGQVRVSVTVQTMFGSVAARSRAVPSVA